MTLNEEIFNLVRARGAAACLEFLESYGSGRDSVERGTVAHWRAALLASKNEFGRALDVFLAADSDFNCRSSLAFQKAELLYKLGRVAEAVATLKAAPISNEVETYPGLAWEAAYFGCYLYKKQKLPAPREWLDLIPDDFTTRINDKSVGEDFIQNATD